MPLTNTSIKNARPKSKPYKMADGEGLYIIIMPKGGKWWRFKYRFERKEKCLSLGTWPEIPLKVARERRKRLRELVANGVDPGVERKAHKASIMEKNANSFEVVAREWMAKQIQEWSETNAKKVIRMFERDIFPWIGTAPIADLTSMGLLKILRKIVDRGAVVTAHRATGYCSEVFRYAMLTDRAKRNICADLKGALPTPERGNFASVTKPQELGRILRMMDGYEGTLSVRCSLRLVPLLFVRPGELRHAKWEDIDFDNSQWCYLVTKTKKEHIVPLSTQAMEILREIQPLTGRGTYIFPSPRSPERPLSNNALLGALRRMGIGKEETCIHGFRATARTILDEGLDFRPDYLEHQLAHSVKDPLGTAYNRTKHLDKRRKIMQRWADYLDELKGNTPTKRETTEMGKDIEIVREYTFQAEGAVT